VPSVPRHVGHEFVSYGVGSIRGLVLAASVLF
jgi:hypothetical protein